MSFDSTKVNDKNKGLINLNQKIKVDYFCPLSDTRCIFKEDGFIKECEDCDYNTGQLFFFDSTKVNDENKGLINLKQKICADYFCRLSDTTAVFYDYANQLFFFDSTKVNAEN